VVQPKGEVAVWAMQRDQMSMPIECSKFWTELKVTYIASNTSYLVKRECDELSIQHRQNVEEFNECSLRLRLILDLHQPIPAEMTADAYWYMIKKGKQGVYIDLVCCIDMRDRMSIPEQQMEHIGVSDTSLNKSQP